MAGKSGAMISEIKIEASWKAVLEDEFALPYFNELSAFVKEEYKNGTAYPPPRLIFNAFDRCPFSKVKVVILGQDPYHGARQAHGLSFSVPDGVKAPPSLQNIYKEIRADLGAAAEEKTPDELSQNGNLERWADQGVLLLNATLTVRAGEAGSHQGRGWEAFTDAVIKKLNDEREHLVFMLWGNYAKNKGALIDREKHLVLEAAHPSPFAAHSGFFGCKHFSKANAYLREHKETEIEW